jgi:hypothetical protein
MNADSLKLIGVSQPMPGVAPDVPSGPPASRISTSRSGKAFCPRRAPKEVVAQHRDQQDFGAARRKVTRRRRRVADLDRAVWGFHQGGEREVQQIVKQAGLKPSDVRRAPRNDVILGRPRSCAGLKDGRSPVWL